MSKRGGRFFQEQGPFPAANVAQNRRLGTVLDFSGKLRLHMWPEGKDDNLTKERRK